MSFCEEYYQILNVVIPNIEIAQQNLEVDYSTDEVPYFDIFNKGYILDAKYDNDGHVIGAQYDSNGNRISGYGLGYGVAELELYKQQCENAMKVYRNYVNDDPDNEYNHKQHLVYKKYR
jgi:hypothetical protein